LKVKEKGAPMLRTQFHCRAGDRGIKTASQILDTAAHLAGYQAQDFPYGSAPSGFGYGTPTD